MLLLRLSSPTRKEASSHAFLAGLVGGHFVFGRGIQSSVNQQIVVYVFARAVLALAKLAVLGEGGGGGGVPLQQRGQELPSTTTLLTPPSGGWGSSSSNTTNLLKIHLSQNAWPVFASLSWATIMWMFRWYPQTIQPSLRSSMKYMYVISFYFDSFFFMLIFFILVFSFFLSFHTD